MVFANKRVEKGWLELFSNSPGHMERCREYLLRTPMERFPGRIFPLKGKVYKGAWEFEVAGGDRVYYVPDPDTRTVTVYYAGKHPKSTSPRPQY